MYELATYFTRHNLWSSAGILLTASGMGNGGSNSGFSWPKYLDTSKMSLVSSFSLMLIWSNVSFPKTDGTAFFLRYATFSNFRFG